MKFFSVIKWAIFLLLLAIVAVGIGVFWLWSRSDKLLDQQIVDRFAAAAPQLTLHIGRTQLVSPSVVSLGSVEIRDRVSDRPVLRAERVTVTIDENELFERQRLLVRTIDIAGIDAVLTRYADGKWNVQNYEFKPAGEPPIAPPSVTVHDLRALVSLEHGGGLPPARLLLSSSQFQAIPSSHDSYDFLGNVELPEIGMIALSGDWNLPQKSWKLGGRLRGLSVGQKLMDLARSANPSLESHLQQLDATFAKVLPTVTVDADPSTAALMIGTSRIAPRFLGVIDLDFSMSGHPDKSVPDFLLKLEVRDGQLASTAISDKLTDISATIFRDNQNLIIRLKEARDGQAKLSGEFTMVTSAGAPPPEGKLRVEKFHIDQRLKPFFPPRAQLFFEHFKPNGLVTGDVTIRRTASGQWVPFDLRATVESGSAEFHKFRYPIRSVGGTIVQRSFDGVEVSRENVVLDVSLDGMAGKRPVTARGFVRQPGPESEMQFEVAVDDLPLDSDFRDALDEAGRKVIDALNISGTGSGRASCYRAPGLGKPFDMLLNATVRDSAMRFKSFPYEIRQLSGQVSFDTRNRQWTFQNLQGRHGQTELTAAGTFRGRPLPGVLELQVNARNGQLDSDLYNALGSSHQKIWTLLQPSGKVNLTTSIHWTSLPDHKAIVRLPWVEIFDAEIQPRPFPYNMKIRSAVIDFDPNDPRFAGVQHCSIRSLKAEHRGSQISASGWVELTPEQFWQLHLNDLTASDLPPDDELRAALPGSWRETLGRLSPQGKISVESSQLDFRGRTTGDVQTTAAWDLNLRLKDCGVNAGLQLQNVSGIVTAQGSWSGSQLRNTGEIRLDNLEVLGMPLTRVIGPYSVDDDNLLFGSRRIFSEPDPIRVPSSEQIRAEGYDGSLLLDGLIDLRRSKGYQLFGTINNARLETYAARHIPDQPNLKGIVNSWIYLWGEGDSAQGVKGDGQLRISPAALFELPLMVKLLGALGQFNPSIQNRTAFDYALLTFKIRDQAFFFEPVDLVGDSLALRGKGSVGFGGDVVLDFYSRPAKPRSPSIPLVNSLFYASTTQWVAVQVRGTINRPQTEVKTIQMDEYMKQFLSAFQPAQGGPIPALNIPRLFRITGAPQGFPGP